MRAGLPLALICLATAASGCGGGDEEPRAARAAPPVELELSAPVDMAVVEDDRIDVEGSVAPAEADVRVLGKAAEVSDGTFTASVPLQPGVNVIDVIATAGGREPALTALRVTRELLVEVPDLEGLEVTEAREELDRVGLELAVERGGGLLEDLLPGEPEVCQQDPEAGAEVRRGSVARVLAARSC